MHILTCVNNFLVSAWIWSITWGLYHVPLAIACMTMLFKIVLRIKLMKSFMLAVVTQLSSTAIFTLAVRGLLMNCLSASYVPGVSQAPSQFIICFGLAIIYIVLQTLFLAFASEWMRFPMKKAFWIVITSNLLAAWSSCFLTPKV